MRGLAFFSKKIYLSNFLEIEVNLNGKKFKSSEHAYQYERAKVSRDVEMMKKIDECKTAKDRSIMAV